MRRVAIITSSLERDIASKDLLEAGCRVADCTMADPLTFELRAGDIYVEGRPAEFYDAFVLRGFNRRGEIDYQFEIFELLQGQGMVVVNSPEGISLAESKSQTTFVLEKAGLPVPRTVVTQSIPTAMDSIREFGMAVLKPLYGSYGIGIERLTPDVCSAYLEDFLNKYGVMYIQEYIRNEGRDIRAFVIGDEIPAAVHRTAPEGEWKTNVYQGGKCESCKLSSEIHELCMVASRLIGLDYTGVDVVEGPDGPVILELNSTPFWFGVSEATGKDIALHVMQHVLRLVEEGQKSRQPDGMRFHSVRSQSGGPHK